MQQIFDSLIKQAIDNKQMSSTYSKMSRYQPISVKIVVVGPSGVGKTSISTRFVKDQFSVRVTATMGAAFAEKVLEYQPGKHLKMQIWDTAGQEKYRSIAKIYYQDAKIALLVYDVTSKGSFEQMQAWGEELVNYAPKDIILAVVGNKVDMLGDSYDQQMDETNYNLGRDYAQSIGAIFKLTSAKNNKGINELFRQLAHLAFKKLSNRSQLSKSKRICIDQKEEAKVRRRCCK